MPAAGTLIVVAVGIAAASAGGLVYLRSDPAENGGEFEAAAGRAEEAAPSATGEPPRFDLVRVAPDGAGLAAGRADPGARVRIRSGETTLAEVDASPSGDFAAIFRAEPVKRPQLLQLEAERAGGGPVIADQRVLLLPRPDRDEQVAGGSPSPSSAGSSLEGQPPRRRAEEVIAAAAVLEPGEPAEVTAALDPALPVRDVGLLSIDYAENGSVRLAGSAPAGSRLHVYVDGNLSGSPIADASGGWDVSLDGLGEDLYRIRVDALGQDGDVVSRIETPFRRTFPTADGATGTVTVQPGNNLWTIARTRYGSGMLYTQVFAANADLIENPDLIYPGQIFALPELERDGGGPQARQ